VTQRQPSVVPGFGLSLGFTISFVSLVVLIPICALLLQAATLDWGQFIAAVSSPRTLAAYRLSLLAAIAAATFNGGLGLLLAWVLERYDFPAKRLIDGLVDLPFALPTAVAGIALTTLYSPNGWLGRHLMTLDLPVAYTRLGVVVALVFVGLPFVVRTTQPVLRDMPRAMEEAAASLGAGRFQVFARVIFPRLLPAVVTGFTLAVARGLGEYGSVIFISGNMPLRSEITPLLIMIKLEEFDYAGASAIALVFMLASFVMLLALNLLSMRLFRKMHAHRG
jgi:sulfate transport system permease protein